MGYLDTVVRPSLGLETESAGVELLDPQSWETGVEAEPGADPWMSWLWLGTWWEHFGGRRRLWLLRRRGAPGVCPLMVGRWRGIRRIGFLGSGSRRHSLSGGAEWAAEAGDWLARQRTWDCGCLEGVPVAQAAGWRAGLEAGQRRVSTGEVWRQRYVPLARAWAAIEAEFAPGLMHNIDRRERGLQRAGGWRAEAETTPAGIARRFDACVAVEASGWKGKSGTAMACHPDSAAFYRAVAVRAARRGEAYLALLWAGERLIAFELYLRRRGRLAGLKIGYDDGWRKYAPGMVLQRWTLRQAQAAGMEELDFSGGDEPFKAKWTPHTRELVNLRVFNATPLGTALRAGLGARAWMRQAWLEAGGRGCGATARRASANHS